MPNEKNINNDISVERFIEDNTPSKEHKRHYRGRNNGLATDEDDLPDRQMINLTSDKDEYIDEP